MFCLPEYIPNLESLDGLVELINERLSLSLDVSEFRKTALTGIPKRPLKLLPGVERLIHHLDANHIPMAIATGTIRPYYEACIAQFGDFFSRRFSHAVCAFTDPEGVHKKPAPDVYHVAANRFATPPQDMRRVLIFEDSATGLKGAIASGSRTVYIGRIDNLSDENKQWANKADLCIDSLEHFDPSEFGLPPYGSNVTM